MAQFGKTSKERLDTCHPLLQKLMNECIKEYDFSVLCGHRTEEEQNACVAKGTSNAVFPKSKHNSTPSIAVDIAPYPIDWDDIDRFEELGELVMAKAEELEIPIVWGKYFTKLKDYPHFELKL